MGKKKVISSEDLAEIICDAVRQQGRDKNSRYRGAITNAPKAAYLRYSDVPKTWNGTNSQKPTEGSGLKRTSLSVIEFTILVRSLRWRQLDCLHQTGLPDSARQFLSPMGLPTFWYDCHEAIRAESEVLGHQFYTEIYANMYPQYAPTLQPPTESNYKSEPETTPNRVAIMASSKAAREFLETFLFIGLEWNYKRILEGPSTQFTRLIKLHMAKEYPADFILEKCVCSEIGKQLHRARMGSIDRLKYMLGGFLYRAMISSLQFQEERAKQPWVTTQAMRVVPDDNDYKVLIVLRFEEGRKVWRSLYAT